VSFCTILPSSSISGIPSTRSSNAVRIPNIVIPIIKDIVANRKKAAKLRGTRRRHGTKNNVDKIIRVVNFSLSGENIAPSIVANKKAVIIKHTNPTVIDTCTIIKYII